MTDTHNIFEVMENCKKQNGYYPISFSYPKLHLKSKNKSRALSRIIPGKPYSFDSYTEYINEYSECNIGLTHKKAGWDCFRHLEIMYAGSIPYMPDIDEIPEFTMVHYPKDLLRIVTKDFEKQRFVPSITLQRQILEHFDKYLTTFKMVQNILRIIGNEPKRVLFLDDAVVEFPDYLSMFMLVGLKQNFGTNCFTTAEPEYLYEDYCGDITSLYGKGFGYTKVLDSKVRSVVPKNVKLDSFDLVVVGSLARNLELLNLVEKSNVPLIYLFGEDLPPKPTELALIYNSNAITFVREVY